MTTVYTIRRLRLRNATSLVLVAGLVVLGVLTHRHLARTLVFAGLVLVFTLARVRYDSLLLRVDDAGIALGALNRTSARVLVPWQSVQRVVVGDGPTPTVGVLLRPEAPRPQGLRGMIRDPGRPDRLDPGLTRQVPGLDAFALHAALTARNVPVGATP